MNNSDYTTLSFFAKAFVSQPDDVDAFAEALNENVEGLPTIAGRNELLYAINAIREDWHTVNDHHRHVQGAEGDRDDQDEQRQLLLEVVANLQANPTPERKLAALALITAMQPRLASHL